MTKSLRKDFFMEIKKGRSRFISIMLIVALGVAFFSGIRASSPAMKDSADAQYDKENLMDIRVVGTLGLTDNDLNLIRELDGVKEAEGSIAFDFVCKVDSKELVTKVISMPQSINDINLDEGRFPTVWKECLVSSEFLEASSLKIGDTIKLATGTSESLFERLAGEDYTIVGVCSSAYFLNGNMGTAQVGDGVVDGYVVIPKEAFATNVYSSIYITVEGADALDGFGKDYQKQIKKVIDELKEFSESRCEIRYSEVFTQTNEKLTKARNEYDAQSAITERKLADAYKELTDSEETLNVSKELYESKKKMLEDAETEIPLSKQRIAEAKKNIERLKTLRSITSASQLKAAEEAARYEEEYKRLVASGAPEEQINTAKNNYVKSYQIAEILQEQLDEQTRTINATIKEVEEGEILIREVESSLSNKDQLLEETEKQLQDAEVKLQRGKEEYEKSRQDAIEQLADAEFELREAETKLQNMKVPEWYVLDRNSIESYASYVADTDSISALGTVFPLIFFIVAALVCLTTMTRMVEEQRTQIGTLKALGYSKLAIASKYILYAFLSSSIGCVIGVFIGELTIPSLIVQAYKLAYYNLDESVIRLNIEYALLASAMAIACTCIAAYAACAKELKSVASDLMRPVAPKVGKRILLEKIHFIWDRLDFTQKAAFRNLVRYKRRFFMTFFGVGGCMALLIVGFGINDSVSAMANEQYGNVFKYDGIVSVDSSLSRFEKRAMLSDVQDITDISSFAQAHRSIIYSANNANDVDDLKYAYLVVPNDMENFEEFVAIQPRKHPNEKLSTIKSLILTGEVPKAADDGLELTNDGVVITDKYAEILNVGVGDTIFIRQSESDALYKEVQVTGITENYMFNYVYMSRSLYSYYYGEEPPINILMIKLDDSANAQAVTDRLLNISGITSVTLNNETLGDIDNMVSRLIFIVIMMIVAAALLAFVVIYNLNNINISERRRELATIKVLGFYDGEVARYVYRENIVLTILGTLLGMVLGIVLHRFVMGTVETDVYMFGRNIKFLSIVISAVLTVIFSMLVNWVMYYKLKKIDMVESLKSVE